MLELGRRQAVPSLPLSVSACARGRLPALSQGWRLQGWLRYSAPMSGRLG